MVGPLDILDKGGDLIIVSSCILEVLRVSLGIDKWLVFGGSWGSTLALYYSINHPERCLGMILRGIFLGSRNEIDWFLTGMGKFYPEAHSL